MKALSPLLVAALFLAPTLQAQCSTLVVTGTGKPGTSLELKLTGGSKSSMVFLGLSASAGTTKFNFGPLGTLTWDLASPIQFPMIGRTDKTGKLTVNLRIPPNFPAFDIKGQTASGGLVVDLTTKPPKVAFVFCTSNVVSLKGGG